MRAARSNVLPALPGERHRVQLEAANARRVQRQRHQPPEIVIVAAARDHRQQRRRDAVLVEQREHARACPPGSRRPAARGCRRRRARRTTARCARRSAPSCDEQRLVGEKAQAVRRDRHPVNPLVARTARPGPRSRGACVGSPPVRLMIRRSGAAARRWPSSASQLGGAHVPGALVLVVRVADRAVEVAGAGDRHDRQRDVLLVRRAGAAVERAALADRRRGRRVGRRQPGRLGDRPRVPVGVGGDRNLRGAVLGAALAHHDGAARAPDDGRHRALAHARTGSSSRRAP